MTIHLNHLDIGFGKEISKLLILAMQETSFMFYIICKLIESRPAAEYFGGWPGSILFATPTINSVKKEADIQGFE